MTDYGKQCNNKTVSKQPTYIGEKMAKKQPKSYAYLEQWATRNGLSDRVVIRKAGRFVDNVSLTALRKGQTIKSK